MRLHPRGVYGPTNASKDNAQTSCHGHYFRATRGHGTPYSCGFRQPSYTTRTHRHVPRSPSSLGPVVVGHALSVDIGRVFGDTPPRTFSEAAGWHNSVRASCVRVREVVEVGSWCHGSGQARPRSLRSQHRGERGHFAPDGNGYLWLAATCSLDVAEVYLSEARSRIA